MERGLHVARSGATTRWALGRWGPRAASEEAFQFALGIVTGIGGFLEAGSIATAAQSGADFGYGLLWTILLGAISLIFLIEMSGRFSAVSGHTIPDAMRERFGFPAVAMSQVVVLLVSFLVLAANIWRRRDRAPVRDARSRAD